MKNLSFTIYNFLKVPETFGQTISSSIPGLINNGIALANQGNYNGDIGIYFFEFVMI